MIDTLIGNDMIETFTHADIEWITSTDLPTRFGTFRTHIFHAVGDRRQRPLEHLALVYGDVRSAFAVPVRVHSECMTGEVFGSLKCDCRPQLDMALEEIARRGAGAVLYLRQEGRGIGLTNKIRAYELQANGHDTVDANRMLGLPDDARSYEMVPAMLDLLGINAIALMTNNPDKVSQLKALGVNVVERLGVVAETNSHSAGYLDTKRRRMGHHLPTDDLSYDPEPR
jgi:GTP cyclohydrolase II